MVEVVSVELPPRAFTGQFKFDRFDCLSSKNSFFSPGQADDSPGGNDYPPHLTFNYIVMATNQLTTDPVAHSVAVQLPVFNRLAPTSWFHLADANFHLRAITASDTKYWYVVSKLDPDTLLKLSAFLSQPRGKDPYAEIREVLCGTYEPSLEQKLDALLAAKDLGDDRPSEYVPRTSAITKQCEY